jgi:hypothetical protein
MNSREKWEKELEEYNIQKKERKERREAFASRKQEVEGVIDYGTFDPEDPKKKYKGFEEQYVLVKGVIYKYIKIIK